MTMNDRPVENRKLQRALDEVKRVFAKHGFAGACIIISPDEAAFFYAMHAPWSAIRADPSTTLGWRLIAIEAEVGREVAEQRMEGAVHTVVMLRNFGSQTMDWMEQVGAMMRQEGINWDEAPQSPLPQIRKAP